MIETIFDLAAVSGAIEMEVNSHTRFRRICVPRAWRFLRPRLPKRASGTFDL
ncbi:hypothetical protein MOKP53_46220 [Mycobacterium avium subsp. hominissuis]